jgi:Flp pilus assembly pilin Flp
MKNAFLRAPGGVRRTQRGAAAVEFALVASLFLLTLLVGIVELGRTFFYMNGTAEATRLGARIAVVCDPSAAQVAMIRSRMQQLVSVLPADKIDVIYDPPGCTQDTCRSVTVRVLPGATFDTVIPFVPLTWTLPAFATTLPRESLNSAGGTNPVCR